MRLSKILHPEIVLKTRGNRHLVDAYKHLLVGMSHDGHGFSSKHPQWGLIDPNMQEHLTLCYKFREENALPKDQKPGIYYMPSDFSDALSKLDREIPVDLLPERWFGYIAFADGAVFDEQEEVQGAYVFLGRAEETALSPEHYGDRVIWMVYVCKDTIGEKRGPVGFMETSMGPQLNLLSISRFTSPLKQVKVSDLAKELPTLDFSVSGQHVQKHAERVDVFRLLLNAALYINSVDADLVPAPMVGHLSNRQKKERAAAGGHVNECTVPVTLVSWNYRKPIQRQIDLTWVETHPRWQRVGPNLSQVKLIWVAAHERHYNDKGKIEI